METIVLAAIAPIKYVRKLLHLFIPGWIEINMNMFVLIPTVPHATAYVSVVDLIRRFQFWENGQFEMLGAARRQHAAQQ